MFDEYFLLRLLILLITEQTDEWFCIYKTVIELKLI